MEIRYMLMETRIVSLVLKILRDLAAPQTPCCTEEQSATGMFLTLFKHSIQVWAKAALVTLVNM